MKVKWSPQVGDLVALKSGGPVLTVESTAGLSGAVKVSWFTEDDRVERTAFALEMLTPWTTPKEASGGN